MTPANVQGKKIYWPPSMFCWFYSSHIGKQAVDMGGPCEARHALCIQASDHQGPVMSGEDVCMI